MRPTEIEVAFVSIEVPVRYGTEDIPDDFPLRRGDMWRATVNIDTGQIQEWPKGKSGRLQMKVVDEGSYTLLAPDGSVIDSIEQNYCPNAMVPGRYGDYVGRYGDYVDLEINADGVVTNWPKHADVTDWPMFSPF